MATKVTTKPQSEIQHIRDIISAADAYAKLDFVSVSYLSKMYDVTQNTITLWFLEAISKMYITDDNMCEKIRERNIAEYEKINGFFSHSLRKEYEEAFTKRECNKKVNSRLTATILALA